MTFEEAKEAVRKEYDSGDLKSIEKLQCSDKGCFRFFCRYISPKKSHFGDMRDGFCVYVFSDGDMEIGPA